MGSLTDYFSQARSIYLVIFSLFLVCTAGLTVGAGMLLYGRLKRRILETQNILILLPISELLPV